jgi:hypothetical protein
MKEERGERGLFTRITIVNSHSFIKIILNPHLDQ